MNVLYCKTGSSGNAVVISDGKTIIQVDAGIKPETVNRSIGYKLSDVKGLFASHFHLDHLAYLKAFLRLGIPVYVNKESLDKANLSQNQRYVNLIEVKDQINIGTFIVKPFEVAHVNSDGSDCQNFGFLIYSKETKEKMLHITDAAYIKNKFPPVEYINIECNYIDIDEYINEMEYINATVEKRRFNSHLSLKRCVKFLKMQDLTKVKEIRLIHLTKHQGEIESEILKTMKKQFPSIKFIIA